MKDHQPIGPYNLVGYSFGAGVAFEMAGILQKEDPASVDHIILLDGSHQYMKTFRNVQRHARELSSGSLEDDPGFEVELLSEGMLRSANIDTTKLQLDLLELPDWRARVDVLANEVIKTGILETKEKFVWACNTLRDKFLCADKWVHFLLMIKTHLYIAIRYQKEICLYVCLPVCPSHWFLHDH